MRRVVVLAALAASVGLVGCGGGDGGDGIGRPDGPVEPTIVENAILSRVGTAKNVVARDEAAWSAIWAEHTGPANGTGVPRAKPAVDFSVPGQTVAAIFIGHDGGCRELSLSSVTQETVNATTSVVVRYRFFQSLNNFCLSAAAPSSPAIMLRFDSRGLPVTFQRLD